MNKHVVYLTKEHELENTSKGIRSLNTFVLNENGRGVLASWVKKNVENNDGSFIISDHHNDIQNVCGQNLAQRNYFIETVDFGNLNTALKINPFDLVKEPNDLHFVFMNLLHIRWDKEDKDIEIMMHLIDAFTTAIYFLFRDNKEKQNMRVLHKMVQSIGAKIKTPEGKKPLYEAIFESSKDPDWAPKIHFNKFLGASGDRKEEIANKVLTFFNTFSGPELDIMSRTDASVMPSFNFKTAYFINSNSEEDNIKAKTILYLLLTMLHLSDKDPLSLVVLDDLNAFTDVLDLPVWIQVAESRKVDFLMISNNIAEFKSSKRLEKIFRTLQNNITASVLIHKNPIMAKYQDNMPVTEEEIDEYRKAECIATVLVPNDKIHEEDEVF